MAIDAKSELDFRLAPEHVSRLTGLGEYFAAGFFSRPDEPVVVRVAEGIRQLAANVALPEYNGELLYPAGPSFINRTNTIFGWFYVSLTTDVSAWQHKREGAAPEDATALDALWQAVSQYPVVGGYTHSIPHYDRVLTEGLDGFAQRIALKRGEQGTLKDEGAESLYDSLEIVLDAAAILRRRCIEVIRLAALDDPAAKRNRQVLLDAFSNVPHAPARGFREAMIATNFIFYLDGCDDFGRFDQFMLSYYEADRTADRLTRDDARAMIEQIWKNVDDASGWNAAIGGSDASGAEASNELTILSMEAARGRRRPNLALRLRRDTPEEVWDAALDTMATGCGLPALYCEENYIRAMREVRLNLPDDDMFNYAFGGCTELMIHGRSNVGSLDDNLNLPRVLVDTLHRHLESSATFSDLMRAYREDLRLAVNEIAERVSRWQAIKAQWHPQPVRSLLIEDCIDRGREYAAGGARYNWSVINVMGLANATDSLCALREVLYEKREFDARQLLEALTADFAGHEPLRKRLERCPRYGNGDERADNLARDLSAFVFNELLHHAPWRGGRFIGSCLMFTTYAWFGKEVAATPDGRHAGAPIADSAGPMQGRDRNGPTALMHSVSGIDQFHAPGTLVVNVRFAKNYFCHPAGRSKIKAMIRSYFDMGGMQLQVSVVDQEVLKKAMAEPEKYADLLIRIGGFTERWSNLSDDLRATVLERSEH